jgi:hypothetical protein
MKVVQDEIVQDELAENAGATPVYDPAKKYSWGIETKFTLNGQEFGLILNSLRSIINTEEAVKILLADKSCQVLDGVMKEAVETGRVVEVE